MLPCGYARGDVARAESGRSSQQDNVYATIDNLLKSIEP
jgi:hypothetical protein